MYIIHSKSIQVSENMRTMTISKGPREKEHPEEEINGVTIEERDVIEVPLTMDFKEIDLEFQRICARNGYNDIKIIRYRIKEWVDKMKEIESNIVYE
jgi:hypothetical protein